MTLEDRLSMAERRIRDGKRRIAQQCARINEAASKGRDTTEWQAMLQFFHQALELFENDRAFILRKLDERHQGCNPGASDPARHFS